MSNKCCLCGKFRKFSELACIQSECEEEWIECKECMSQIDLDRYFPDTKSTLNSQGEE